MKNALFLAALVVTTPTVRAESLKTASPRLLLLVVGDEHRLTVDATGNEAFGAEADALLQKLSAGSDQKHPFKFDLSTAQYPKFLTDIRRIAAVTTKGRVELTDLKVQLLEGCSGAQLTIASRAEGDDPGGLASLDADFPPTAKVRAVVGRSAQTAGVAKTAARAIFAAASANLSRAVRQRLAAAKVGPDSLKFAAGKFANNAAWLVWADETLKGKGGDGRTFAFAGLVDHQGKLVQTILAGTSQVGDAVLNWTPLFSVDVDGDGLEEIVGKESYYESANTFLYGSESGKAPPFQLLSDGC